MTLQEKQEGYLQELGSLEDEFDQYTWLMQLACQRPELCQVAHQEERRFLGCQSNLWVELGCQEGRLSLSVDSDTLIVKGLGGDAGGHRHRLHAPGGGPGGHLPVPEAGAGGGADLCAAQRLCPAGGLGPAAGRGAGQETP